MAHLHEATKLTDAYLASYSNDARAEIVEQLMGWSNDVVNPFKSGFAHGFLDNIRGGWIIEDCRVPMGASINPKPFLDGTYNWHRVLFLVSTKEKFVIYSPNRSFKLVIDPLDMTGKLTLSMNVAPTFESFVKRLEQFLPQPLTEAEVSAMNGLPERLKHLLVLSADNELTPTTRQQEFQCSCVLQGTKIIVRSTDSPNFELVLLQTRPFKI